MNKVYAISITKNPQSGMIVTNSEFNYVGKISFVSYGIIYLYSDESIELPPGRYEFDFETEVTISVPTNVGMLIESFRKERVVPENIPVPDIPDLMEDSERAMVEMIDRIIKARGYKLDENIEIQDEEEDDGVILDTVSLVVEDDMLDINDDPVVTEEQNTLSPEPVVTEELSDTTSTQTQG